MKVICDQNAMACTHLDGSTIIGWMHGDEPDNAQSLGESKDYGPPIPPKTIVRDYLNIRAADPSRPVMRGSREIHRVYAAYPHLNDDAFVATHRDRWLDA